MTLVKFKNNHHNHFPSLFDTFFNDEFFGLPKSRSFTPAANVKENDNEYGLELSVPGFNKKDFSLSIEDGMLKISAETKTDNQETEENYARREFYQASFSRSFTLPENIDEDKIAAKYDNGILRIVIPKMEKEKAKSKLISIG